MSRVGSEEPTTTDQQQHSTRMTEEPVQLSKRPCPFDHASLISKYITFYWVTPLLKVGLKRDLEIDDLFGNSKEDNSDELGEQLQADWYKEVERCRKSKGLPGAWGGGTSSPKKPSLLRVFMREHTFWFLMSWLWLILSHCIVSPIQAMLLGQLIQDGTSYYSQMSLQTIDQQELDQLYWRIFILGLLVILATFITSITIHPYFFCVQHLGMKMRVASCNLVYQKTLRLSKAAMGTTTVGQIVNLLSNDVNRFDFGLVFIPYLVVAPLQAIIIIILLSKYYLGLAPTLAGFSVFILYLPFQAVMGKWFGTVREETAVRTDERIRLMNEIVPAMRVIKMYAWENSFARLVDIARRREIKWIKYRVILTSINESLYFISAKLIILICLITLVLLGYQLTAEAAFVTITMLDSLRLNMTFFFPFAVASIAEMVVSCERLQEFLLRGEQPKESKIKIIKRPEDEIDPEQNGDQDGGSNSVSKGQIDQVFVAFKRPLTPLKTSANEEQAAAKSGEDDKLINLSPDLQRQDRQRSRTDLEQIVSENKTDGTNFEPKGVEAHEISAAWIADDLYERNEETTLSLTAVNFVVRPGELMVIVGRVGSGKSSILMAIMGELPIVSGDLTLYGRISYASQEPWIFAGSVEENILFGAPHDENRLNEVIQVCALHRDIELLPNGKETLVGERGISLSGGQKARVNLARALYADADVYLLDDPLSAVDASVAKHIFEQCIKGFLKSKTVILVTHQLQFAKGANKILVVDQGRQIALGSYRELSKQVDLVGFNKGIVRSESESEQTASQMLTSTSPAKKASLTKTAIDTPSTKHSANQIVQTSVGSSVELTKKASSAAVIATTTKKANTGVAGQQHPLLVDTSVIKHPTTERLPIDDDDIPAEAPIRQTTKEELSDEVVGCDSYLFYLACVTSVTLIIFVFLSNILAQALFNGSDFYLSFWTDTEERRAAFQARNGVALQPPATPPVLAPIPNVNMSVTVANGVGLKQSTNGTTANVTAGFAANEANSTFVIQSFTDRFTVEENSYIYSGLIFALFIATLIRTTTFFSACMRASISMHDRLFRSVMSAPISFFDFNPIGILLNRISRDMGIVDDRLPQNAFDVFEIFTSSLGIVATVIVVDYINLIPTFALIITAVIARRVCLRTINRLKEMEGILRSQVFSHLSTTLAGLSTIRSFKKNDQFIERFNVAQDEHSVAWFTFFSAGQWLGLTLDLICMLFILFVIIVLTATISVSALNGSQLGLAISSALVIVGPFQWGIRQLVELESHMTSVKRIKEYSDLPKEAAHESEPGKKPPSDWPQTGRIVYDHVSLRYFEDEQPVLRDLTFEIRPREKVGIVGRTGAGKSSIIAALFRMTEPSGRIIIDGIDISSIGLKDLRRSISIIPQDPILFSGSVRRNLDPFFEYQDDHIWSALEAVRLKPVVMNLEGGLEGLVAEGGQNFSVGQRQLFCLARAILRRNRILVLDEATANVDPETDLFIQRTIRELFKDCTVMTIAHRLNTIMDSDRVLVLDAGQVCEFDEPHVLLTKGGQLATMTANTGQQADRLRRVAERAYKKRHNIN
jgi:ABC-type multidrug transport system fused ATPase/permease subunit